MPARTRMRVPTEDQGPIMAGALSYTPLAATAFGVPQFLPQMLRLRARRDAAGVSWSWVALTTVSNAAWIGYFALSQYWIALIPSCSVTLLAGALTVMLARWEKVGSRAVAGIGVWAAALAAVSAIFGRAGLGTLLTAAFAVQVAPSLRAAYRTAHPTGISAGTWTLILGELACFLAYGLHESDPRLIALGATGVTASTLMLGRIFCAGGHSRWMLSVAMRKWLWHKDRDAVTDSYGLPRDLERDSVTARPSARPLREDHVRPRTDHHERPRGSLCSIPWQARKPAAWMCSSRTWLTCMSARSRTLGAPC